MMSSDSGSESPILNLADIEAGEISRTGGKGANLARLIHAGFPVPEGFCLTTALYRELIDDTGITRLIDELEDISAAESEKLHNLAGRIREHIQSKDLSVDVQKAIESIIDARASYSVRSSATAEDLPTASFAGQHDTLLDIIGLHAITRAILQCMASLYTDRAVSYRAANNILHRDVSMAVVVQQMIEADTSGVLFTADPVTGRRTTASIDAAFGSGEAVVSGTVTAENILLDRRTGKILEI
ncbi:PEP/pyruvate-binding domain-containing protein, partial [Methanocalculus sp. MSAO_Arc2]|uniref:PEP/pyruvate-binding domain-containing protein n=1 Tax=Methanocalculus sp. MSAO_Arc2 TaxID=2293855 RepID=UPI003217A226